MNAVEFMNVVELNAKLLETLGLSPTAAKIVMDRISELENENAGLRSAIRTWSYACEKQRKADDAFTMARVDFAEADEATLKATAIASQDATVAAIQAESIALKLILPCPRVSPS